jgi:ATP-dependent Zn protease
MKITREIDLLIRARYPLINIISYEDERVLKAIEYIIENKKLISWTMADGFQILKGNSDELTARDPLVALEKIDKFQGEAVFILKNFHLFWKDNRVIIKLDSMASHLSKSGKTLIFITPVHSVPLELKSNITTLNFPLPDYEEMDSILEDIRDKNNTINGNIRERIVKSALGLTSSQAGRVFFKCITNRGKLDEFSIEQILQEKKLIIGEIPALKFFPVIETMSAIGGLGELKNWIKKREKSFTQEAKEYGLSIPKGLLLMGIPGTGKSLIAKAIAGSWKMPLLRLDIGAIFGGLVGQSEENIRTAISISETIAPCILWIDEIEKGLFGQSNYSGDSGVTARVTSTLLTWMQEKTKPVFIVATANDIKGFSPEEIRMGRFDAIFFLDLPDMEERKEIFKVHLEKRRPVIRHYDTGYLASITGGYTGAEIEQIIIEAMHNAFYENGRDFIQKDIEDVTQEFIPSSEMMKEKIQSLREWVRYNRIRSASDKEKIKEKVLIKKPYVN